MTSSICTSRNARAQSLRISMVALSIFVAGATAAGAADEPGALTKALGLRTSVPAAPEFVVKTRRETNEFIPVHAPRKKPEGKPMAQDEVRKREQALDSARKRHDRLAGRNGAAPEASIADELEPKARRERGRTQACGLTCPNPSLLPSKAGKEAQ